MGTALAPVNRNSNTPGPAGSCPAPSLPEEGAQAASCPRVVVAEAVAGLLHQEGWVWALLPTEPGTGGHAPAPQGPDLPGVLHSVVPAATYFLVGPTDPCLFAFYQNGLASGPSDPGAGTRGVPGTLFPKMGFGFVQSQP